MRSRLLSSLVLLVFVAQSSAAAPGDPGCQFDFDGDGQVTQLDVDACTIQLQIFPPIYNPACDANGDGQLSPIDLLQLVSFIGLNCSVPVPSSSDPSRWLLLGSLLAVGAFVLRRFDARPSERGRV